jgi:hypothetical protein
MNRLRVVSNVGFRVRGVERSGSAARELMSRVSLGTIRWENESQMELAQDQA